jgi:hypothetical protein
LTLPGRSAAGTARHPCCWHTATNSGVALQVLLRQQLTTRVNAFGGRSAIGNAHPLPHLHGTAMAYSPCTRLVPVSYLSCTSHGQRQLFFSISDN